MHVESLNYKTFCRKRYKGGGPKSRYPPSEIFENAIRGGPNKWFPPPKISKKWKCLPPPYIRDLRVFFYV